MSKLIDGLKAARENLGLMLRNRAVFITTALQIARERPLTREESEKALEDVGSILKAVDAELLILIFKLEGENNNG